MYTLGREQLAHRARRDDRQGDLDSRRPRRHQRPRHQLLAERRRQGQAAAVLDQQLPPGDRRRTGKSILTFGTNGIVDLRTGWRAREGTASRVQSNNPGKVWKNLLILGSAPGEGLISPPGDIRAYDVVTGKKVWQFHTVPRPGEFGYETWPKDAYKYVGGSNNWGSMSIDDERGIVYIPTGSATYDFYGADRHGANLFANCLLALDTRTGKRLWHFQTIHHDLWDLDNVSAPQLVTVRHNGRRIDAVAHAGKTGFLYVFNRVTGEPLWPIEERPVPQTDVPGEQTLAHAAVPDEAGAVRPADVHGRRRQSVAADARAVHRRCASASRRRTSARDRRADCSFRPSSARTRSRCPATRADRTGARRPPIPQKGIVFVLNMEALSLLRLEDVRQRAAAGRAAAASAAAVRRRAPGLPAELPGLPRRQPAGRGAGRAVARRRDARLSDDAIRAVVTGGRGLHAAGVGHHVGAADRGDRVPGRRRTRRAAASARRRGAGTPAFPPGPVVGRGGAPQPPLPARGSSGRSIPASAATPATCRIRTDVTDVPRRALHERVHRHGGRDQAAVHDADGVRPQHRRDQVAGADRRSPADDRGGGPTNTGGLALRTGIMPTKSGLVFLAGGDGKLRAYDEDTGKVLWIGTFAGVLARRSGDVRIEGAPVPRDHVDPGWRVVPGRSAASRHAAASRRHAHRAHRVRVAAEIGGRRASARLSHIKTRGATMLASGMRRGSRAPRRRTPARGTVLPPQVRCRSPHEVPADADRGSA